MKTEHFRQPLSLMRFLAVILITNSHIGPLYPPHLQFLSTGGALGNSLFFFCSGFALYLSNRDTGFAPWAIRRFTRIYPSLWIFMTVCFLGGIQSFRLPDIIIPTFWFLQAIFVFYVFFFYSIKFLKGSCGKSVPPLSFRYSSPISMCPIMNGLSKTPNTTTFYIGILLHHYAVWSHRRPTADKYRKPFFHRPTAVGCPIDCYRLLQLKNIYTSLSQSHL